MLFISVYPQKAYLCLVRVKWKLLGDEMMACAVAHDLIYVAAPAEKTSHLEKQYIAIQC